jgi:hypothetical protein
MSEVSETGKKPVNRDTLADDTISGLINTRLIESKNDIVSTWVHSVRHGYPVPSLSRDRIIRKVIRSMQKKGIYSRGRFGGWLYEVSNQDHSLMQGVEWVDRIFKKIPEITINNPEIVNAGHVKIS